MQTPEYNDWLRRIFFHELYKQTPAWLRSNQLKKHWKAPTEWPVPPNSKVPRKKKKIKKLSKIRIHVPRGWSGFPKISR